MIINDETKLRAYLPNIVAPGEGESSLYDKLSSYIQDAELWALNEFIGDCDYSTSEVKDKIAQSLSTIIVNEALRSGAPSLDLVLTQDGFGIIESQSRKMASKDRVDRLITSFTSNRDNAIFRLMDYLNKVSGWIDSSAASKFNDVFFKVDWIKHLTPVDMYDTYLSLYPRISEFCGIIADNYLSREYLESLCRSLYSQVTLIDCRIMRELKTIIIQSLKQNMLNVPRLESLVNYIRINESDYPLWSNSIVASYYNPVKYENKQENHGYWL